MLFALSEGIPFDQIQAVTTPEELREVQQSIAAVHVADSVADYLLSIVQATRSTDLLRMGASPRASRALFHAAKTMAAMQGRTFVTPDDVRTLARPVLTHRLLPSTQARLTGATAESILEQILLDIPAPPKAGDEFHGA